MLGTADGPPAWVFSDVYGEVNCEGAGDSHGAAGKERVMGPGSADQMGQNLLLSMFAEKEGPDDEQGQVTSWSMSYYNEMGIAIVENDTIFNSSYQLDFTARTPQKVAQGTFINTPMSISNSAGWADGNVSPSGTPKSAAVNVGQVGGSIGEAPG